MAMGSRRKNRYCYRVKLSAYVRAYKMMYESDDEDEDEDEDEDDGVIEDNAGCTFCDKLRTSKVSFQEKSWKETVILIP